MLASYNFLGCDKKKKRYATLTWIGADDTGAVQLGQRHAQRVDEGVRRAGPQHLLARHAVPSEPRLLGLARRRRPRAPRVGNLARRAGGRGLHSSTFQLNLNRFLSLTPPTDPAYPTKPSYVKPRSGRV